MRARAWFHSLFALISTRLPCFQRATKEVLQMTREVNAHEALNRASANQAICIFALIAISVATIGCGGGGNAGSSPTPTPTPIPPADFTLNASTTQVNLGIGFTQSITVSITQSGSYLSSPIAVTLSGLPGGVTATPSTFTLSFAGTQQQTVVLSASATATGGTSTLMVQAASVSLSHSAQVSVTLEAAVSNAYAPLRSRYLRTNGYYDLSFADQHMAVYDVVHGRFFVSNPDMNEIDVFDATEQTQIATIAVSSPWGIDLSPYNGMLYTGTLVGDVYAIDPGSLEIVKRYPAASIGPKGFRASAVFVLSDGRLALQGPIAGLLLDGYEGAAVWDPMTNSLDQGHYDGTEATLCPGSGNNLTLTGDRTKMVMRVSTSPYTTPTLLCTYDPIAQQGWVGTAPLSYITRMFPAPTGSIIYVLNAFGVDAYDANTGEVVAQNPGPLTDTVGQLSLLSGIASSDGKTLYLTVQQYASAGGAPVVVIDATTLQIIGWVPSTVMLIGVGTTLADAIDPTGLIVGPIGGGVGFVDASRVQPSSFSFVVSGDATPGSGAQTAQTSISQFASGTLLSGATIAQVYVGNLQAQNLSFTGTAVNGMGNTASATTPISGVSGPVDLTTIFSDGALAIGPEAFSYGPDVLQVLDNAAPADGGETAYLVGYGLGGASGKMGATDSMVSVGNMISPAVMAESDPLITPYPFPVNELMFTVPSGTAGTPADLTVMTAAGSMKIKGGFHYIPAVQKFPLADTLQGGIYDQGRARYYFAGQSTIEVLTASGWQTPISLPGTSATSLLAEIAESPDGSKMAISDEGGQAIYILDPDNPTAAVRFAMPAGTLAGFPSPGKPTGIAVTNDGRVYFVATNTTTSAVHCWDSVAGTLIGIGGMNPGNAGNFFHVFLSPDGKTLYTNAMGMVYSLDVASGQITNSFSYTTALGPPAEMSMSRDGSTFEVQGAFADASLNVLMFPAYKDWEGWYVTTQSGMKLNGDGSILFIPTARGLDVFARNTGRLLYRVALPDAPASGNDPLVLSGGTNVLAIITGSGVDVVDMSSFPISTAVSGGFPELSYQPSSSSH